MARCFECKRYRIGDDLILNRTNWEYECKDKLACQESITSNSEYNGDVKRKRNQSYYAKKRKGTKKISKESIQWNRMR